MREGVLGAQLHGLPYYRLLLQNEAKFSNYFNSRMTLARQVRPNFSANSPRFPVSYLYHANKFPSVVCGPFCSFSLYFSLFCKEGSEQRRAPPKLECLLKPARPRLILGHYRPVVFALAMRQRADEAIAPDIAARQRHADSLAGGKREIGVF